SADELSSEEFVEGGRRLEAKLRHYRPTLVAFLGITAYRSAYNRPRASMGRQPELISGSILWVLPNPSGLNAHHQLASLARLYSELRRADEIQPGPPQPGESEGGLPFIS